MKQELVRMQSIDGIELPGMFYTPDKKTNKIVIHVHGLSGNFYENPFLDVLANTYTQMGYAFVTFNNRGREYITEMIKQNQGVILGSCYESFEDCVLDIEGVVNWVKEKGYDEMILQGHSYGCNKVVYYYDKKKEDCIKKIVLLAPCDIPTEVETYTGKNYETCKQEATRLVKEEKKEELIDFPVFPNGKISAKTFYYDFLYDGSCDFFRYREKDGKSEILNRINIPVLVLFGDQDGSVLTQPKEVVTNYLQNNIDKSKIILIEGANHSFLSHYEELAEEIKENL